MHLRRTLAVLAGLAVALVGVPTGQTSPAVAAEVVTPLTNLDHLDWLGDTVEPPDQPGHTTYRLAEEPEIGVLWTYAEPRDGVLTRVGGGPYDTATDTYAQGAFNADDVARAAVVYIRHWVATGSPSSREQAYQMLRGLTYLQTASGAERRQRRALDAARRHAQPQRVPDRAARPVRQRRVVLGRAHHLGPRRGLRRVRGHGRPG